MNLRELPNRMRLAWAPVRAACTRRRIAIVVTAVGASMVAVLAGEAFGRARLDPVGARLPTALYTRPVAWSSGSGSANGAAVAIGEVAGGAAEDRVPLPLHSIPERLVDAVLAVEDQRFFDHDGLDIRRIGGAMLANVRAGGIAEGGSTITQQLAKNLFLTSDRTPVRKLREAAIASMLEARYSKAVILEAYLNEIYLGQDRGRAIHGVGAAAWYYFGKTIDALTLGEAAVLAGMIHAPNRLAPTRNVASATERRDLVLRLMLAQGRISADDESAARAKPVKASPHPRAAPDGRFFRDYITPTLPRAIPSRGAAVYTTLDARLQDAAERAVRDGLAALRQRGVEAALVAIDPRTGELLALVGGSAYGATQFNRATEARRQPGSTFKPIVALAALEPAGDSAPAYTLASIVDDEPLSVRTPGGIWTPSNYDGGYHGQVTLRRALEQSFNIPFARVGLAVGPDRIVAMARRLGVTSPLTPVPSLALGSGEVTLLEMVRAFGVLANEGKLAPLRTVVGIGAPGEWKAVAATGSVTQVVDPAVAFLVTSALEGVVTRGTARGLDRRRYPGALAAKTGTSNDWRDAWFIAYSPRLAVGVWVGRDDGISTRLTGATGAMPIAARFLGTALRGMHDEFEIPPGLVMGHAATDASGWFADCESREYFLRGTEPPERPCFEAEVVDSGDEQGLGNSIKRAASRFFNGIFGRGDRNRDQP